MAVIGRAAKLMLVGVRPEETRVLPHNDILVQTYILTDELQHRHEFTTFKVVTRLPV